MRLVVSFVQVVSYSFSQSNYHLHCLSFLSMHSQWANSIYFSKLAFNIQVTIIQCNAFLMDWLHSFFGLSDIYNNSIDSCNSRSALVSLSIHFNLLCSTNLNVVELDNYSLQTDRISTVEMHTYNERQTQICRSFTRTELLTWADYRWRIEYDFIQIRCEKSQPQHNCT